jgi:hypothetical protein
MELIERVSDLKKFLVIAREEGIQLGTVSSLYVNPETRTLAAIAFRARTGGPEFFVRTEEVLGLGHDVLTIPSKSTARPIPELPKLWRNTRDLQGT